MSIENGKLPVPIAQQYIKNWINRKQIGTNQLRAFTIRRTELEFLLLQMDITSSDAARFYLGDKAATTEDAPDLSLIMAGVQGFVPDIFLQPPFVKAPPFEPLTNLPGREKYFTYFPEHSVGAIARRNEIEEPIPGEYVFDFAYPCPHTCELNSPLMDPAIPVF
jgi:hypothetical protein